MTNEFAGEDVGTGRPGTGSPLGIGGDRPGMSSGGENPSRPDLCVCGCERPAKTKRGYHDVGCHFRRLNQGRRRERGPAPWCKECGVIRTKWCTRKGGYRDCCDRACSAMRMRSFVTPERARENAERLAAYSRNRRPERLKGEIDAAVGAIVKGRDLVPAAEVAAGVKDAILKHERQGYQRGYGAHAQARYREARRAENASEAA